MVRYLLQQPRNLQNFAIEGLGNWIAKLAKEIIKFAAEQDQLDPAKAEDFLSRQIETIRNYLERYIPKTLHDEIAGVSIRKLEYLAAETKLSLQLTDWKSDNRIKIIGRMIELLFTKHLTSLSLDYSKLDHVNIFIPTLLSKSHMLRDLIKLDVILINTNIDFRPLLQHLHNLKHLSLRFYLYTVEAFQCIVENCKMIETLHLISDSEGCSIIVPYDMVVRLTKLTNLRSINIHGRVGYDSVKALLLSCKHIEQINIDAYGDHSVDIQEDEIACALKYIFETNTEKRFNLKSHKTARWTTLEQLVIVTHMCPHIERMSLKRWLCVSEKIPLNLATEAICKLQNLRELELRCYHFYECHVKELLEVKGRDLEDLTLYDLYMDLNALTCISKNCPNLERLNIQSCYFHCRDYDCYSTDEIFLDIPPFRNLKTLSFSGCWLDKCHGKVSAGQLFAFLLSNCPNIEFVEDNYDLTTDSVMFQVLNRNPMIHLKELTLKTNWDYAELSTLAIDSIIDNCINPPVVAVVAMD